MEPVNRALDLSVALGALSLANPVLTASGTFGYAAEFAHLVPLHRLGGVVVKGISLAPRPGNPPPRVVETPCGMLNAIGLENVGVQRFISDKMPFLRTCGCRVIVNIPSWLLRSPMSPGSTALKSIFPALTSKRAGWPSARFLKWRRRSPGR